MRAIEFRGMTISGEWVYGYVRQNTNPRMKYQGWFIADSMHEPLAYEVRPETIGQFTGLLDKNGTKIYEGDIIAIKDDKWKVVFDDASFKFESMQEETMNLKPSHYAYIVEVIGNIHQNQELIKELKE